MLDIQVALPGPMLFFVVFFWDPFTLKPHLGRPGNNLGFFSGVKGVSKSSSLTYVPPISSLHIRYSPIFMYSAAHTDSGPLLLTAVL